ncbi:MAG: FxLYD domain-containing protein [Acidimicrobiales bacterium]
MSDQPLPPPAPGQGPIPPQQIIIQQKKGGTWWKVLLVLFGLLVLGTAGCVALIGGAAKEVSDSIDEAEDQRAADEALVEDNAVVTACVLAEFGTATATVEFTNPLDEEKGYVSIEVGFLDDEGTVVGSGTVVFENLSPGQKAVGEATAFDLADGTTSVNCEVTDGTVF